MSAGPFLGRLDVSALPFAELLGDPTGMEALNAAIATAAAGIVVAGALGVMTLLTVTPRWRWLWSDWLTSTDHKRIGIMYVVLALVMLSRAVIEAVLMRAPFIRDAAVFGAPDPEFGEQVVAAIEPSDGWVPDKAEVMASLDGKLARFKQPRIVDFHDALPREDSGKIFKPRLRKPYWEGAGRKI